MHHDVRGLSSSTPTAYLTIVVYTYWFPRIIHYGKIHLSYYQSTVYGRAIKISIFPPIFGCISEMIQKRHSYCDVVCQIIAAVMSVSDFNVIQLLQTSKSSISEHYLAYVKYSAVTRRLRRFYAVGGGVPGIFCRRRRRADQPRPAAAAPTKCRRRRRSAASSSSF